MDIQDRRDDVGFSLCCFMNARHAIESTFGKNLVPMVYKPVPLPNIFGRGCHLSSTLQALAASLSLRRYKQFHMGVFIYVCALARLFVKFTTACVYTQN